MEPKIEEVQDDPGMVYVVMSHQVLKSLSTQWLFNLWNCLHVLPITKTPKTFIMIEEVLACIWSEHFWSGSELFVLISTFWQVMWYTTVTGGAQLLTVT